MLMADPPDRRFGFEAFRASPASRSSPSAEPSRAAQTGRGGVYFAGELAQPTVTQASPLFLDSWIPSLAAKEQSLLRFLLAQDPLRRALCEGPVIELRASGDATQSSLLPASAVVEINSGDAAEANFAVRRLKGELGVLLVHNALQLLIETREFLGLCFSKLAVGGMLIITVPHQFLYERKLRLPSRRNPLHRRFYTPNTLLADIEEAIDPCECRVRYVGDNDSLYDYAVQLDKEPDGGQDLVVAIEKIDRPMWRAELDKDELWSAPATGPVRYVEVDKHVPATIRTIAPDPGGVNRIILVKLDHRGDFMMAKDAFEMFRDGFKTAEITLVCGSWNAAEAKGSGLFDRVMPFDFFPEDDSARLAMPPREVLIERFAEAIAHESYDLAVDLRLSDDTREALRVIRARNYAGFDRYDAFPWLSIRMSATSATEDDRAETRVITASDFSTSLGRHRTFEILLDEPLRSDRARSVVWGPYVEMKQGNYRFECLIEPLGEAFEAPFDIVAEEGTRTLHVGVLAANADRHPEFYFQADQRLRSFEFRIFATPGVELKPFRFLGVRLVREPVVRGLHQREAMALLAHLVQLRLRDAYTTEVL
jgi:hypothetical protein